MTFYLKKGNYLINSYLSDDAKGVGLFAKGAVEK